MRGHDEQVGALQEEHRNGQSPRGRSDGRTTTGESSLPSTRRVVRRVDPWSVLKVSIPFYLAVYCILLVAAVLLWLAATATGLRDNIEQVVADLIASGKFHFVGAELLQAGAVGGALLVVFGTAANVMLVVLYNLITDLVGGVSIVVTEPKGRHRRRSRAPATSSAKASAPRSVAEPARHAAEVAPAAATESPRILIPEVERRQTVHQPVPAPAPRPGVPAEHDPNLEAFGR